MKAVSSSKKTTKFFLNTNIIKLIFVFKKLLTNKKIFVIFITEKEYLDFDIWFLNDEGDK